MTSLETLQNSVLSTERVRRVDQLAVEEYGMHSLVLMENAGLGCVDWIQRRFSQPLRTTILCGRGNNGGDGLVIARHLQLFGWDCQTFVLGPREQLSSDNHANLQIVQAGSDGPVSVVEKATSAALHSISNAQLVIDAMLGTGATGDPRPPFADWIEAANASNAFRLAIDIPTGTCAETGSCGRPSFQPDTTLTFVAKKPAMNGPASESIFGRLTVLPIGIPESLVQRILRET